MIRVKLLSRLDPAEWARYLPGERPVWGDCEFISDREARDYDWLVVCDDKPPASGHTQQTAVEPLACPRINTVLVTFPRGQLRSHQHR